MTHHCPTGAHPQPSTSCYSGHGCGCDGCTEAAVDYCRDRRRQVAYGRWRGKVDATRARAIVAALREQGATNAWIAEHASLAASAITYIANGERTTVRAPTDSALTDLYARVGAGVVRPPGYARAQQRRQQRERKRRQRSAA